MLIQKFFSQRPSRSYREKRKQRYFRPMQFQKLEDRYCLAFTMTDGGGVLTFTGTAGGDTLIDIYVQPGGLFNYNTIWYDTNTTSVDSWVNWPIAGFPTVGVAIDGLAGRDIVDFRFATFRGFPAFPFDYITFAGGSGNDDFWPPPAGGVVLLPGPGASYMDANIRFYGGLDDDQLFGSVDPEYFQGHEGDDFANDLGGNDFFHGGPDRESKGSGLIDARNES